jgi:hypothetical protein
MPTVLVPPANGAWKRLPRFARRRSTRERQPASRIMRAVAFFTAVMCSLSCNGAREAAVSSASADSPFVERVLSSAISWRTVTTQHFIVHGVVDSYAGDHLMSLGELAERARETVLGRIGEADTEAYPRPHLFLVRGPDDIRTLVGQPAGGWTEPDANAVLVAVGEEAPPALRHELGHLFTHRLWGRPRGVWLSEGVAVYAVGHCAGIPLHQWAAALQRAGESASLDLLQREFDFTRAAPHLLAGSFVTFVVDRYGIETVRMLWQRGLESTQRALDASGIDLEAEWHATLHDTETTQMIPEFRGRVRCESYDAG